MKMYQIEVYMDDGDIYLCQSDQYEHDRTVVISMDQAEIVTKWILEFAGEKKCTTTTSI